MKMFMRQCTGAHQLNPRRGSSYGLDGRRGRLNPPPLAASASRTRRADLRTQSPSLMEPFMVVEEPASDLVNPEDLQFREKIGQGVYGTVYKAEDPATGVTLAVKEIETSGDRGTGYPYPFKIELEADIHQSLSDSPSVATLKHHVKKEKSQWIATELCEGGDLKKYVSKNGPMNERQVAAVARSAVDMIETCHSRKIFYGDTKASNFVIGRADDVQKLSVNPDELKIGWLKTVDFGCSMRMGKSKITNQVGTPTHWPPEVFSQKYGLEADLWALGTMLHQLMTLRLPFFTKQEELELKSKHEILIGIITKPLDLNTSLPEDTSPLCKDFLTKLLNLEVAKRMTACEASHHPFLRAHHATN